MANGQNQIHLLVEAVGAEAPSPSEQGARGEFPPLVIPAVPVWLWCKTETAPQLRVVADGMVTGAVLLEPTLRWRMPRLLLVNPGPYSVIVNGLPSPEFVLLKERDSLRVGGKFLLHVAIYHQIMIGTPPAELVGKECPVCRVPLATDSTCYVCVCGTAMHCEAGPENERLQCAALRRHSGCPACQRPVVLEAGYSYWPWATS